MIRRAIRLLVLSAPVLVLSGVAAQQPPGAIRSPEVASDRRVTFRLAAPKAADVQITCECFTGAKALQKDDKGLWSLTVGPVEPDIYEYEFSVDGVTATDPRNPAVKYNSRPSPASSLLEVPGASPMFYDVRSVPHGTVHVVWYPSKTVSSTRRMHVYTPPGYERGSSRLPVLYLLHGADGDDSSWSWFGKAPQILDNLIADKKMTPMVVVMPFGYAHPPTGAVAADRQRADFEKDLLQDIIPYVQANYRVRTDRDSRALVGLSMGGGQALNIGLRRLDTFSRVGAFSGAVPRDAATSFKDVKIPAGSLKLLWLGCGTEDSLLAPNREFSGFLKASGVPHTFKETSGAHTWIVWRRYLQEVAPQLFPQT